MTRDLITGHEAEIEYDRAVSYTPEQRAAMYLKSAIEAMEGSYRLDFLDPPTPEEVREKAIRLCQTAIDVLRGV